MEIKSVRIDAPGLIPMELLAPCLSPETQGRLGRLRNHMDRVRSLLGELLVRAYAADAWGMEGRRIHFVRNEYGKPALESWPDLHFNISHSGLWVAAAFDRLPVGIDVEEVRPVNLQIADRFFSPLEISLLHDQPEELRLAYFYKLWTLKESYVKAKGGGLSIPLDSFSLEPDKEEIKLHAPSVEDENIWRFLSRSPGPGYQMAVCSRSPIPATVEAISCMELVRRFSDIS